VQRPAAADQTLNLTGLVNLVSKRNHMQKRSIGARLMQMLRDNARAERQPLNVVRNNAANESTIYIYDVIDPYWGVSDLEIAKAVASMSPDTWIKLRVNSPGGDVFTGRAIANVLAAHPGKVTAYVDALAASAATTVVDAADEVVMAKGSFYMVHNSWTIAMGNKGDFTDIAALLAKIDGEIAADYVNRTSKTLDQVVAWMDAETWFTAQEAVDAGFATSLAEPPDKSAGTANSAKRWNLAAFANAPKALLEPVQTPAQNDADWAAIRASNERRLRLLELA
jgi:ATP-dependent Clp protease protease subunit